MVRIKWGGSLTSFVVIGVILVFVVGGAAYYVQARGAQARQDIATKLVTQQAKQLAVDQKAAEKANNTTVAVVTTTPASTTPTVSSSTTTSTTSTVTTPTTTTVALPHTGIAFSLTEYLGLGLLVAAVLSYLSSRRQLLSTL
jgi:hypothetical protein